MHYNGCGFYNKEFIEAPRKNINLLSNPKPNIVAHIKPELQQESPLLQSEPTSNNPQRVTSTLHKMPSLSQQASQVAKPITADFTGCQAYHSRLHRLPSLQSNATVFTRCQAFKIKPEAPSQSSQDAKPSVECNISPLEQATTIHLFGVTINHFPNTRSPFEPSIATGSWLLPHQLHSIILSKSLQRKRCDDVARGIWHLRKRTLEWRGKRLALAAPMRKRIPARTTITSLVDGEAVIGRGDQRQPWLRFAVLVESWFETPGFTQATFSGEGRELVQNRSEKRTLTLQQVASLLVAHDGRHHFRTERGLLSHTKGEQERRSGSVASDGSAGGGCEPACSLSRVSGLWGLMMGVDAEMG
ncbi:hypothetical protein V8G54_032360 [Vigna mungo]|uniref:Uncharacterized protein n=1 Tax=Vigna mungo TaxID=3915 RepID=A0AAQ3MLB7_VIGMU